MYGFVANGFLGTGRVTKVSVSQRVAVRKPVSTRVQMNAEPVVAMTNLMIAEGGGMAVTFPAYLAVFLGTLIPIAFLILLYTQSEARKAGERSRD